MPDTTERWQGVGDKLEVAPYSNRGYAVDIVAPGGRIDRDEDGDGNPEAIVAPSLGGQPSDVRYVLMAGTSQATAHVTGVIAMLLAARPGMTARDIRKLLGASAATHDMGVLSNAAGYGSLQAKEALALATQSAEPLFTDRFAVAVHMRVQRDGTGRRAVAHVEVMDEAGAPAVNVTVFGGFRGAVTEPFSGTTDEHGMLVVRSAR